MNKTVIKIKCGHGAATIHEKTHTQLYENEAGVITLSGKSLFLMFAPHQDKSWLLQLNGKNAQLNFKNNKKTLSFIKNRASHARDV
ncbi:hypothetical protein [Tolumonas lignilytica]|uniref:hypothetical protein n=1 Tax=Tolumonas lignilytica TaxID=1283284 RepID=UPI001267F8AC|nr:hypothetical protein [Tolumonas lignilytica]